jgi:hypothetical protein
VEERRSVKAMLSLALPFVSRSALLTWTDQRDERDTRRERDEHNADRLALPGRHGPVSIESPHAMEEPADRAALRSADPDAPEPFGGLAVRRATPLIVRAAFGVLGRDVLTILGLGLLLLAPYGYVLDRFGEVSGSPSQVRDRTLILLLAGVPLVEAYRSFVVILALRRRLGARAGEVSFSLRPIARAWLTGMSVNALLLTVFLVGFSIGRGSGGGVSSVVAWLASSILFVAAPVAAAERSGVGRAFGRSADLLHGCWSVGFVQILFAAAPALALGVLVPLALGRPTILDFTAPPDPVVQTGTILIGVAWHAVSSAVTYAVVKEERERVSALRPPTAAAP